MAEEWGDFSHYRPVGTRHVYALPETQSAAYLSAAAAAAAEQYFDLGYPGIAWKITEGTSYEDPTWRAAYSTAVRRGKWFLGYHFDRAAFDGAAQFDWYLSRFAAAGLRPGLDRLCLDSEDTNTPGRARASALAFTNRAVARGYPVGCLYSAPWYDSYTRPNTVRLDLLPAGWQVGWLSDYTVGQPNASIELPDGWARDRVWARQYTSTRPGLPGLPMGCDFNRTLRPWPGVEEDTHMSAADVADLKAYLTSDMVKSMVRQEVITALSDPTHAYLQDELAPLKASLLAGAQQVAAVAAQVTAQTTVIAQTAARVAAQGEMLAALSREAGGLDAAALKAIADEAARAAVADAGHALDSVSFTVHVDPAAP